MWIQLNIRGTKNVASVPKAVTAVRPEEPPTNKPATERPVSRNRALKVFLGIAAVLSLWYLNNSVLKYFNQTREIYGIFWPRHEWLFAHAIAGTVALLLGPVQFWPGMKQQQPTLHRVLGVLYVISAIGGSISAFYLAFHTDSGWIFGAGLSAMATVWIISTSIAAVAICRRMIPQHRAWMVRSYVVTFGFVLMRLTTEIMDMTNVGTISERLIFSSWMCWSLPLFVTEVLLQGRTVFSFSSDGQVSSATVPTGVPQKGRELVDPRTAADEALAMVNERLNRQASIVAAIRRGDRPVDSVGAPGGSAQPLPRRDGSQAHL